MLIGLLSELPLAGNPHELQSGPIMLMALGCILKAIHSVSLGFMRNFCVVESIFKTFIIDRYNYLFQRNTKPGAPRKFILAALISRSKLAHV